MLQLTSLDAQFLAIETPRTYGHVGGLAIYDPSTAPGGDLDPQGHLPARCERLHLLPPFTRSSCEVPLGLDHPYWIEDADFDIDFHIRDSAVPPPGDDRSWPTPSSASSPARSTASRPLWELYLIHGLEGGRVAMLTKIHHSVVDGVSGNEILGIAARPEPGGTRRSSRPRSDAAASASRASSRCSAAACSACRASRCGRCARSRPWFPNLTDFPGVGAIPGAPTRAARSSARGGCCPARATSGVLETTTARPPRTPFNGRVQRTASFAFGSLPLDSVKALKNELGITVNDVVVALCATAVRDWLSSATRCPRTRSWRWCRCRCAPRSRWARTATASR